MGLFLDNFKCDLLAISISLIVVCVAYFKWKFTYWKRRGFNNTLQPSFPFGDVKDLMMKKVTFGDQVEEIYFKFKNKGFDHGGFYLFVSPVYLPMNPEIIKHIMQTDFQHFVNHGGYVNEEVDPLSGHLFALEDEKWKNLRIKLTPTFTSGKMKMMFKVLTDCTNGLIEILDEYATNKEPMEIKEVFSRFTTDIIGSAAFGLECNSMKNPDSRFRIEGKRIFEQTTVDLFKNILQFVLPLSILKLVRFRITKPETEEFFMDIVKKTIEYREKNNVVRNDFVHLLLQLKNRGKLNDDDKILSDDGTASNNMTINEFAAQCFVFFAAGFETSSTTSTFALYELAKNQEIQQKVRDEINRVLEKHDGKITYAAMMEMPYLEQVIHESLRKYPPVAVIPRQCNKDYPVPGSDLVIENGTTVFIPVAALHHDPQYYPNPETFDPDRFTNENKQKRPAFTWLPFGEGPRLCIGLRFGVMQTKVGLTAILKNFKLTVNSKTIQPLVMDKETGITAAQGGVWLNVEKI